MKEKDIYSELSSIRSLMERSAKFISLSGLSGVMAGIYALLGAYTGYRIVYYEASGLTYREYYVDEYAIIFRLFMVAVTVLVCSIGTGILLTVRNARKKGETVWNPVSRKLLLSLLIPLAAGGLFILILLYRGYYGIIAPACLLFYGLALVSGSHYTYPDVKWLGICEVILGLLAALMPGYGLIFWTIGFGLLHILYGSVMHFKYDR